MTQLLFYESAVPVSSDRHRKMSVKTGANYKFAEKVNSVPLTAIEFGQAAVEYPIVFSGNGETVMPCAILGATATKNLFVKEDGTWGGKYVPAFVRRYPFVFAQEQSGKQLILHIDESFEGCNDQDRGERLFDSDGTQTQYLKNVLAFLQDYQQRFNRTQLFCKRLIELDLLRPMEAQFSLPTGESQSLSGFQSVDREKLKAVSNEDLGKMMRTDELECLFLHLASLRHFGSIAERFSIEDAGGSGSVLSSETAADARADDAEETAKSPSPSDA
ncbi:SapC family protein [Maribius pontilimi]|uniref:SapC family protein n=1 Tax=Palleronia pontilimi TaxID=1964209 RepID=A0A934IFU0_9RHOB|nr:SapC family protein [Palleronia pontilimi]MBJ3761996.1 SapC family protein [Palleronia pontilimi]